MITEATELEDAESTPRIASLVPKQSILLRTARDSPSDDLPNSTRGNSPCVDGTILVIRKRGKEHDLDCDPPELTPGHASSESEADGLVDAIY